MGDLITHVAQDTAIPLITALINLLRALLNVVSRFIGQGGASAASVRLDVSQARRRPDA